jgi:hypothetical protein
VPSRERILVTEPMDFAQTRAGVEEHLDERSEIRMSRNPAFFPLGVVFIEDLEQAIDLGSRQNAIANLLLPKLANARNSATIPSARVGKVFIAIAKPLAPARHRRQFAHGMIGGARRAFADFGVHSDDIVSLNLVDRQRTDQRQNPFVEAVADARRRGW